MKEIVVTPTLGRVEFLALTLEKIERAFESPEDVRIFLDVCSTQEEDEVEYVRDIYCPRAMIFKSKEHPAAPSGTWNILNSLKQGYESGAELIYLIENDVAIYPDYFNWHRQTHQNYHNPERLLATCGRRKKEYKSEFYTNPGSCLHRNLLDRIVPHICDDYFADRIGYLRSNFGSIEDCGDLDDGLIRRVIDKVQAEIIYPDCPVVAHQGFWAYQKFVQYKTHGTIQERIEQLRNMLPTLNPKDRYLKDFEPYKWSRQRIPNGATGKAA